MKQSRIFAISLYLLLVHTAGITARPVNWVTKDKRIFRHYTVQPADALIINNKFGQVHINTWDKNEVTIDIKVTAKSRSEDKSQEILDHVSFDEQSKEPGRHDISITTVIAEKYTICCNDDVKIDYTISAPRKNAIDIKNKFGDVFVSDFEGKMQMDEQFGALTTQKITGGDKQIKVSFGSADIGYIESGDLDISFSKLTIEDARDITVSNKYGKSIINSVHNLDIKQRYGDLNIGTVSRLEGSAEYSGVNIEKVSKSCDMTLKYCGKANFASIGAGVDLFSLRASYGSVHCNIDEGADLTIDAAATYGSVKYEGGGSLEFSEIGSGSYNHTQTYKGKAGAGKGKMDVDIKYGSLTIK